MGEVAILNVSAGDTKLTFNKNDLAETIRAGRVVKDMLRRGYALLVEVGADDDGKPKYQRARDFDEHTAEYIIADFDPQLAARVAITPPATSAINGERANEEAEEETASEPSAEAEAPRPARKRKAAGTRRVPAGSTKAVAVARTAGG